MAPSQRELAKSQILTEGVFIIHKKIKIIFCSGDLWSPNKAIQIQMATTGCPTVLFARAAWLLLLSGVTKVNKSTLLPHHSEATKLST